MKTTTFAIALTAVALVGASAHAASHSLTTFISEQDLNKDGQVTKDEYQEGRDRAFADQDADKSGGLSRDEYVGHFTKWLTARLPTLEADKREEEKLRQLRQVEVRFGVLDSDKNGQITHAEYNASGWSMWSLHDRDRNGRVEAQDAKVAVKDDFVAD